MNVEHEIKVLLGLVEEPWRANDPVPSYLAAKYHREGAAGLLAEVRPMSPEILGALVRTAFCDDEEDVRVLCLESISALEPDLAVPVLLGATYDSDPTVRVEALELLAGLSPEVAVEVARRLESDPDSVVVDTAKVLLQKLIP